MKYYYACIQNNGGSVSVIHIVGQRQFALSTKLHTIGDLEHVSVQSLLLSVAGITRHWPSFTIPSMITMGSFKYGVRVGISVNVFHCQTMVINTTKAPKTIPWTYF